MLASDLNNPNFAGATNPDSLLHVTFYMKTRQDNFKSEKEGRPIFYEVPYIRILTPGNQLSIIDTPAQDHHKQRFPLQWQAFMNSQGEGDQIIGTPLDQWPGLSRSRAEELKAVKFFTVEQVANASDQQIQSLGMDSHQLRMKAQAFIRAASDSALEQRQAAEIARKDEQIEALQASVNKLTEQMTILMQGKPKRKYTRKNKEENHVEGDDRV